MNHRQSLGNFEPYKRNNISKERIFDPIRNLTPMNRKIYLQNPSKKNQPINFKDNKQIENKDKIIKLYTSPNVDLEDKNDFRDESIESTRYLNTNRERLNKVKI